MDTRQARSRIEKRGALLVFPIDNRKEFPSLWSEFYPRTKMLWEWDEGGDDRVPKLWHLRTQLAEGRRVVYAKWFKGRATFFSFEAFPYFLRLLQPKGNHREGLSSTARHLLEILDMDSPLSTKELRLSADLKGKFNEPIYTKAMNELWTRLLIVGTGEKDDGAFPSLMIASTRLWFEDLWNAAFEATEEESQQKLDGLGLAADSPFRKFLDRQINVGRQRPKQ